MGGPDAFLAGKISGFPIAGFVLMPTTGWRWKQMSRAMLLNLTGTLRRSRLITDPDEARQIWHHG